MVIKNKIMFIITKTKIMSKYIKKKTEENIRFQTHVAHLSPQELRFSSVLCYSRFDRKTKILFFPSRLLKQEETYKKNLSLFKTQKRKPNNSYTHISLFDHLLSLPGDNKTQVTIIICQIIKLKKNYCQDKK